MNKKLAIFLSLMILAIISVGVVCAGDNDTVKLNGFNFTIPEGFSVNNTTNDHVTLLNDNGDMIKIKVEMSLNDKLNVFGDSSSLGSKEGVLRNYNNGNCSFFYLDDGHMITITAPNQSLIESVIS